MLFATVVSADAQDLHFSQFINSPLLTNPANCGFIPDGDFRLGVNYRNQWASLSAFPYKTMSVYGDAQLLQNDYNSGWLGLGGVLLRDVAGTGALTSTKLYGSVAYHQMVNYSSLLSLGFNVGWSNKQINTADLTFPSQWNGQFFDAHQVALAPSLTANNINYFDLQVGMNYAYFPNENLYVNAGFSASHLNKPKETFFASTSTSSSVIPVRYTAFINGSYKLNDQVIVNPNAYISIQAKSQEIVGGLNAHYNLSGDGEKELIAGVYYRVSESFIPMVGLGIRDIAITFSYDATASSLKQYNGSRGAFEFSLVKKGILNKFNGNKQETICPTFK
jgi:type IX secretion system PorP/SprF family membrane protein